MADDNRKSAAKRTPRKRTKAKAPATRPEEPQRKPKTTAASESRETQPVRDEPVPPPTEGSHTRVLATIPLHVRWRDLDAFNHVNNSSYLTFLEESRLQWLRGVPGEWFNAHAMPVMAAVELHYRKPITWPAEVDVQLTCERLGKSSLTIGNRIVDRNDPSCVYADGNVVMVWVDPASGASVPLPQAIRDAVS